MLLQTRARDITKKGVASNLLQSGANVITKCVNFINYNICLCYKVRRELLKSGAGNILQSGSIVIAKWGAGLQSGSNLLQRGAVITKKTSKLSRCWDEWRSMFTDTVHAVSQ